MVAQRHLRSRVGALSAIAAALVLLATGCSTRASPGGDDKAGGAADPVVLRMASTSSSLDRHPALQYFVDRVKELSGGALRIDVAQRYGGFAPGAEQQVVHDVGTGKIELGWVGTAVLDTVGVTAFQALTAPMLIDNNPLEKAVLATDIPAKMLSSLIGIGVDGIAVLADGLRKPIAVAKPLLAPADYEGITFEAFRSAEHGQAIRALGATPTDVFGLALDEGLRSGKISGFEKGLHIFDLNQDAYLAPYVTANVNLWPHTVALIASPRTMTGLSATQRGWLTDAASDAASRSTDLTDDDSQSVVALCEAGARFANASEADLQAMRDAFDPVYASLDNDPVTKAFVDRINDLKQSTSRGPALAIPSGCTGTAPFPQAAAPPGTTAPTSEVPVGTYRWTITSDDALAHGTPSDNTPENLATFPWVFTITMTKGTWSLHHRDAEGDEDDGGGTYTVAGNQISFDWATYGYASAYTFSIDGDSTLHLVAQPPINPGDEFVWSSEPWTKIADGEGSSDPEVAVVLDGTYRWTITSDDALAHGTSSDKTAENLATFPWVFTITMSNGTMHLKHREAEGDFDDGSGTFTVDGDELTLNWPNEASPEKFTYTIDDDHALHLDPVSPMNPGDQFVEATKPWAKIG